MDSEVSSNLTNWERVVIEKIPLFCETIVRDMKMYGFCVIDEFLGEVIGQEILNKVKQLYSQFEFSDGQLVNRKVKEKSLKIRGDKVMWMSGNEHTCDCIGFLIRTLDTVINRCITIQENGCFGYYDIKERTKAMIACYPGNNSKYVRHIDNPDYNGRCVTSIYYLNKDYNRERDGGVLHVFPSINPLHVGVIEPKFDRVIFFWSDRRTPHEVLPAKSQRFAITVWYFDANERKKAIERYKQENMPSSPGIHLYPFNQ